MTTEPALLGARPMRDSLYGDLVWSRPSLLRRELHLEAGSELIVRLSWDGVLSHEAVAESADGRWIIGRHRFRSLLGTVTVREAATGAEVATFTRGWRRTGTLRFASGAEYTWERDGFWRPTFFWSSARQERLVAFKWVFAWRSRYDMEVHPAARGLAELPVLVLLGAYVMAQIATQSHAY